MQLAASASRLAAYLVLGRNEEVLLAQGVDSRVLLGNFHLDRVHKACTLQLGNLGGHSGTEQLCPPLLQPKHLQAGKAKMPGT